jgi:hypothetical protein
MKSLQDLIGNATPTAAAPDRFFAKYGLAKNPFPTARTIIPEVIYNQQSALQLFAYKVRDILQATHQPEKRSMAVLGGTGSQTYIEYESNRSHQKLKGNLLTDDELDEAHRVATAVLRSAPVRQSGSVTQAQLLDALHNIVEKKRAEAVPNAH